MYKILFALVMATAGARASDFNLVEAKVAGNPAILTLKFATEEGNGCSYRINSLQMDQGAALFRLKEGNQKFDKGLIRVDLAQSCLNSEGPNSFELSYPVAVRVLMGPSISLPTLLVADYQIKINGSNWGTVFMDFVGFDDQGGIKVDVRGEKR